VLIPKPSGNPKKYSIHNIAGILLTVLLFGNLVFMLSYNVHNQDFIYLAFPAGIFGAEAVLLAVVMVFFAIVLFKMSGIKRAYLHELESFTDALHNSNSETDAYEIMYNFLRKMAPGSEITVSFHKGSLAEDSLWQNTTGQKSPICDMPPNNCPALITGINGKPGMNNAGVECPYRKSDNIRGNYCCIPLIDSSGSHSVLQIYSKSKNFFSYMDVKKIRLYVEIARMAANNRRIVQSLSRKASIDKLTTLYNRAFLDSYLDNQLEASRLSALDLSVIMIDIDHYKEVNDTFGHTAGDYILTVFSDVVLKCVRKSDLVARYGGDEFIVVLPSTTTETAYIIAERIRETLSSTFIPPFDGMSFPNISCSLGISTFPLHCNGKSTLIKTADRALYRAKSSGRNNTVIYTCQVQDFE